MSFDDYFAKSAGLDVPGGRVRLCVLLDSDILSEIDAAVGEERSSRGAVIRREMARWTRERQTERAAA